jgi:hypothetical protein
LSTPTRPRANIKNSKPIAAIQLHLHVIPNKLSGNSRTRTDSSWQEKKKAGKALFRYKVFFGILDKYYGYKILWFLKTYECLKIYRCLDATNFMVLKIIVLSKL